MVIYLLVVVWTLLQHKRNAILFYQIDQISIWSITCQKHSTPSLRCMLTSLSVDEMLLLRYINWSVNFRDLPLWVFKTYKLSFIYIYIEAMPPAFSRLCNRDSAWAGVFARSAWNVFNVFFFFFFKFEGIIYLILLPQAGFETRIKLSLNQSCRVGIMFDGLGFCMF